MGGCWPVADGYVLTGDQYKLYEAGQFNDVNVIIGTNSDEGSMFVQATTPVKYTEGIKLRFGPFAERILANYPGNTEAETYTSSADIFRDTYFAWPSWAWARLQSRTGKSKVFVYYFDQQQSASPFSPLKPRGAAHASELAYVFKHIDPDPQGKYKDEDRQLSQKMALYWTNFAKTGDPNGAGIPEWPSFSENKPLVMYLNNSLQPGPVPNLDKLQLMEEYFKFRREEVE
jgi:para-nitrobenzyl esterase